MSMIPPPLNSLTEAWNQSSDGTLGYEVHRSPAFSSGDAFMTVSTNRLYEDQDVTANTEYAYRIRPFTVNGERSFGQAPLSPALICTANSDVECYMNYTTPPDYTWSNTPSPTPTPPEDSESKFGSEFTLHIYLGLGIGAFVLFCVAPAILYFCCIRTSKR